jgi:hypothetical protein
MQQGDDLAVARRRDGLCLLTTHLPAASIERLTDVSFRVREYLGNLLCRFVAEVADLVLCRGQHPVLTTLEPLVSARALSLSYLFGLDLCKPFSTRSRDRKKLCKNNT